MNHSNDRISHQQAADVFALAARLQAQKQESLSQAELLQAGGEAYLRPEFLEEALQIMQAKQIQNQTQKQKMRLRLTSGAAGAAIALLGVAGFTALKGNSALGRTFAQGNNAQLAPGPLHPPRVGPGQIPTEGNFSTFTGVVEQYLLNPEGLVDGLLLNNGVQVKFPPQAGENLTAKGTEIEVTGNAGVQSQFGQEVRASQIRDRQTQQILVLQPPNPPSLPTANYSNLESESTIGRWLVGRRGEVNGAILASGVQVKFPPHVGEQLAQSARVGDKVQVQGFGTRNNYGQVIQATTLSVNGQSLEIAPREPRPPQPPY